MSCPAAAGRAGATLLHKPHLFFRSSGVAGARRRRAGLLKAIQSGEADTGGAEQASNSSAGSDLRQKEQQTGAGASSGSRSSGSNSSAVSQTLSNLDQLLGGDTSPPSKEEPQAAAPPAPPPPASRVAAARRGREDEPPLTFYDPAEEEGWKYTTRCVLVGVVGGTAVLLAAALAAMTVALARTGLPVERWGEVAQLKEGECLFTQQRAVCRKELAFTQQQRRGWASVEGAPLLRQGGGGTGGS